MKLFPSKRRMKRIAFGLLLIFGVLFLVNGVMAWRIEGKMEARRAAIRAAGDPASISDLKPAPIPEAENAAAILEALRPKLDAFSRDHAAFYKTPEGKAYDDPEDLGELPNDEQLAALRAILDKHAELGAGISAAAACELYASQADYTKSHTQFLEELLDRIQDLRSVSRYLDWQVRVLLAEGKHEAAVERGIEHLRLARFIESEPTLVSFLVAEAVRGVAATNLYDALAAGDNSPELHAELEQELVRHDDPKRFARALRLERGFGMDAVEMMGAQVNPVASRLLGWSVKRHFLGAYDYYDELIELAELPPHDLRKRYMSGPQLNEPTGHGVFADLLVPALRAAIDAHHRHLVTIRALRAFNALREFAETQGREARGLEELSLPAEALIDPYSGKPLNAKLTDDGWIIYSVMDNGLDDGGNFKKLKDHGLAPRGERRAR